MRFILSIDGGGMKGLLPATMLQELELRAGKPCHELFDMVAGTSIGGILACLIGSGKPASKTVGFFEQYGPIIFGNKQFGSFNGLTRPRYSAAPIESVVQEVFGVAKFNTCKPHVVATAYDLEMDEDMVFKSWEPSEFGTWQVARATSAAQTYFPAYAMRDNAANVTRVLWDGGVVANNPSCIAVAAAAKLWPGEQLAVLSLGCGSTRHAGIAFSMVSAGLLAAAARTLAVLFETNDEVPDTLLQMVIGDRYVRIQPPGRGLRIDDASPNGLRRLEDAAAQCLEENGDKIRQFVTLLA